MSLGKIIISIAVFAGILLLKRTKPNLLQLLLVGFVLSFISSFFDGNMFFDFSFLTFGILNLIYFIYSIYNKRWLPALISVFVLVSFIFKIQHWPYMFEIQTSMVIPIILFVVAIVNIKGYKNEISILGIIAAYALSEVIRFINYIIVVNPQIN